MLDDLSLVTQSTLLAELLSVLEYRGVDHSLWINQVPSREGGEILYPGGLYYLKEDCYIISTWTTGW